MQDGDLGTLKHSFKGCCSSIRVHWTRKILQSLLVHHHVVVRKHFWKETNRILSHETCTESRKTQTNHSNHWFGTHAYISKVRSNSRPNPNFASFIDPSKLCKSSTYIPFNFNARTIREHALWRYSPSFQHLGLAQPKPSRYSSRRKSHHRDRQFTNTQPMTLKLPNWTNHLRVNIYFAWWIFSMQWMRNAVIFVWITSESKLFIVEQEH